MKNLTSLNWTQEIQIFYNKDENTLFFFIMLVRS